MRETCAILVGLESRGADAVRGERFVLLLGVAGDAYGSQQFPVSGADEHAATLGEYFVL